MSFETYNEYKESHIDWIGEIPIHWNVNNLKKYFFIHNGSTPKNLEENWGGDIYWVTPADYKTSDVYINQSSRKLTKAGLNSCGTTLVPKGSIIVSNRAPIGTVAIANTELCTNQGCKSLSIKKDINTKFVYYILSINEKELNKLGRGTTFMELSSYDLGTFQVPITSLSEQKQIANYLDKKTAKIDATIAKNEELIQLLEEKRITLINQVVTKGLNPDVAKKDSGVEWIGEIPEHWEITKLKVLLNKLTDGSHSSVEVIGEGYPYVTVTDLNEVDEYVDIDNCKRISKKDYDTLVRNGCKPTIGDILFSQIGTIGLVVPVDNYDDYVLLSSVAILSISKNVDRRWLIHFLRSSVIKNQWQQLLAGGAVKRITLQHISNFTITIPPISEQKQISQYLDVEISKIIQTISKIQKNINLLDEYKTSLIHHVVTGKIDVRGDEI